jgi:transcription initiation factor IIE alpha subunit
MSQSSRAEHNEFKDLCPNCGNSLETHSNEKLQQCAFSELQKLGADND